MSSATDSDSDLYPPREQKVVVFTPRQVISLLVAVMTVTGGGSAVATFRAFVPSGQSATAAVTSVTTEQITTIRHEFDTLKSDVADNHKETVDKLAETNEKLTDLNKDIKELRQYLMWGGRGRIGVPN